MSRLGRQIFAAVAALTLCVAIAAPAQAAVSVVVTDATLQADPSTVSVTFAVTCEAPAGSTTYLNATIWQSYYLRMSYVEGQTYSQVTCDGTEHVYTLPATTTIYYADKKFHVGKAGVESTVSYCIDDGAGTLTCGPLVDPIRQQVRIHR